MTYSMTYSMTFSMTFSMTYSISMFHVPCSMFHVPCSMFNAIQCQVRRHDEDPGWSAGTGESRGGGQRCARDEGGRSVAIFGAEKWVVGEFLQGSLGRNGICPPAQDGAVLRGASRRGSVHGQVRQWVGKEQEQHGPFSVEHWSRGGLDIVRMRWMRWMRWMRRMAQHGYS
jgi:hypothetical protein